MSKPVVLIDAGELVGLSGSAEGDVLKWDATAGEWYAATGGGTGTVTSVELDLASTGLTLAGGATSQTITSAGTFTLGGTLGAGYGGTGLGAPASGDAGKVLTAKADGTYELGTPAPAGVTNVATGTGLTGGPITSTGTISLATLSPNPSGTKGSATASAVLTVDAYGRTTALSDTPIQLASTAAVTGLDTALSGKVPTARTVSTTSGQLTGGGALSADLTLGLATVGTALSGQGSATKTVTVSTDAYGRVSSLSEQAISGLGASVISSGQLATAQGGTGIDASGATNGEVLVGQSTGSFALHALSQDATMASDGKVTVQGLQARAVSSVAPTSGQTLVWSTSGSGAWVPGSQASGGSGGGGVLYYMNAGTSVPATNGIPAGTYQLGRTAEGGSHPITASNVSTSGWTRVGGFVSDANDPSLTSIPAGIWDFNVWASSTANPNNMLFRLTFYAYDGSTNPESGAVLATSVSAYLYDPSQDTQYTTSFALSQTAFTGKRIYLKLEVQATTGSKDVTFGFGNGEASHVHTTVPSVTGSGFVKVLNDVIVSTGQTVNLASSTDVGSSILGVGNGGTGLASLTNHGLVIGQGSAAVASLVGTTLGDVVRWNGTDWASAALSSYAVTGLTGTTDQVNVSASVGAVTLSLPQSIASTSSPTFAGLTVGSLSGLIRATAGVLAGSATVALGSEVSGTLPVGNGGTGVTSLTSNALLVGGSTVGALSGTASGQVATWNGTAWTATAPATSGTVTSVSSSTTLSGLTLSTTTGTTTPVLSLTGTLGVASGGTGATTLTGYLKGSGTAALTAAATIPVADVTGAAPLASPTFTGTPAAPTAASGTNTTQLATTAFVTTAVAASSGAPYDVSGEAAGTLANGDEIWHFKATRAFTLSATAANHLAGAVTAPSGTCVITVYKNTTSTQVFTITYTASSTGVIGSVTNNTVAQGDLLFAKITSGPSTISNPYWTFFGTL